MAMMQDYKKEQYIDRYPIAMAYVPWQQTARTYENLEEGFRVGTIFPELNKPFMGRRRGR